MLTDSFFDAVFTESFYEAIKNNDLPGYFARKAAHEKKMVKQLRSIRKAALAKVKD